MSTRIAMLGAAPEQMAAAVRLAKAGWTVTVIEPGSCVGGRGAGVVNEPWRFDGAHPWLWGMEPDGPMGRFLAAIDMAVPVFEMHECVSLRCAGREYPVDEARFAAPFGDAFQTLWNDILVLGPAAQAAFTKAAASDDFNSSVPLSEMLAGAPDIASLADTTALQALQQKGDANESGTAMLDALCTLLIGTPAETTPLPVAAAILSTLTQPLSQPPDGVGGFLGKLTAALEFHNAKMLTSTNPAAIERTLSGWSITLPDNTQMETDMLGLGRDFLHFAPAMQPKERENLAPLAVPGPTLATLHMAVTDTTTDDTHPWSIAAAPHMLLSLQTEGFSQEPLLSAAATFCPVPGNDETSLMTALQQHDPTLAPAPIAPAPGILAHTDTAVSTNCTAPRSILACHAQHPLGRDLSFSLFAACCAAERLAGDDPRTPVGGDAGA